MEKEVSLDEHLQPTLQKLHQMLREDLSKNVNKDLIMNIGGVRISAENLKLTEEESKEKLRECFYLIKELLQKYIIMKPDYYDLVSLWIIGTYFHKEFNSFPYLFFNAMKGSGKSRTLKLVTSLSDNGRVMASPTEAVLFRTVGTLGIDEFEGVASKEKSAIRELLNASYKKGIKIMRMKKKKSAEGEEQVVEEFEPYRPIVMANIFGMDEVLGDRCISIILEKSENSIITKLIEDFEDNETIKNLKIWCSSVVKCSLCIEKNINKEWNNYIIDKYKQAETTPTTYTTYTTHNTQTTHLNTTDIINTTENQLISIFNKIDESDINGRNLELFMPLFLIAQVIDKDFLLDRIISISKNLTDERKHEEELESADILLIEFISKMSVGLEYQSVKQLTRDFREMYDIDEESINQKWLGRALKRLSLIVDKRRVGRGVEVIVNSVKAKENLKIFRKKVEEEKK